MVKYVFVDIDGTLINSKREVTDQTKRVIRKCVKNGIKLLNSLKNIFDNLIFAIFSKV